MNEIFNSIFNVQTNEFLLQMQLQFDFVVLRFYFLEMNCLNTRLFTLHKYCHLNTGDIHILVKFQCQSLCQ